MFTLIFVLLNTSLRESQSTFKSVMHVFCQVILDSNILDPLKLRFQVIDLVFSIFKNSIQNFLCSKILFIDTKIDNPPKALDVLSFPPILVFQLGLAIITDQNFIDLELGEGNYGNSTQFAPAYDPAIDGDDERTSLPGSAQRDV